MLCFVVLLRWECWILTCQNGGIGEMRILIRLTFLWGFFMVLFLDQVSCVLLLLDF